MPFLLLKEFCKKNKISLSKLSRSTGIARVSLSRYAHGRQNVTLKQLFKIASFLGCSVSELIDEREDLKSPEWQNRIASIQRQCRPQTDKSWVPRLMLFMQTQKDNVSKA